LVGDWEVIVGVGVEAGSRLLVEVEKIVLVVVLVAVVRVVLAVVATVVLMIDAPPRHHSCWLLVVVIGRVVGTEAVKAVGAQAAVVVAVVIIIAAGIGILGGVGSIGVELVAWSLVKMAVMGAEGVTLAPAAHFLVV
jgi:hypothetical protein